MLTLKNKTKNLIVINKLTEAKSYYARLKGLLGKTMLAEDEGLLIETQSIHTFFMKFTIDAVFVNKNFVVTKVHTNLKPWRLTPVHLGSKNVIELKGGKINSSIIEVGDQLHVGS